MKWSAKCAAADKEYTDAMNAFRCSEPLHSVRGAQEKSQSLSDWWFPALDWLASHSHDGADALVESLRQYLQQTWGDNYRTAANENASSLMRRISNLHGLKFVLSERLKDVTVHG